MSKKPNTSKIQAYEGRMKSCFGKKGSRADTFLPYQTAKEKNTKPKIQQKKGPGLQKKQQIEKGSSFRNQRKQGTQSSDNKGSSQGTQGNIVIDCMKQVQASIMLDTTIKQRTSPDRRSYSKDQKIKDCDISNLKNLICRKLNDCNFFTGQENIRNSSKRLLFLEYKNTQIYINKSREKSKTKQPQIPQNIKKAFQKEKSPDNYFSIVSRIPTQETYDTSDPSAQAKKTPPALTPRSILNDSPPSRRGTFAFSQSVTLPLSLIQKPSEDQQKPYQEHQQQYNIQQMQHQPPSIFYPQNYYWNSGYQNLNMSNYYSQSQKSGRTGEFVCQTYNIDIENIQMDGRTTLMIKNIPNKYTRQMLIQLLDKTEKKKYDFFYLPIDPDNSCNIGYAFINFLESSHIKSFYERFNGKKWQCFNSEKICKLTYARMQGTSSLAEHIEFNAEKQKKRKGEDNMNEINMISNQHRQDHRR